MDQFSRIRRAIPRLKRADLLVDEMKRWIVAGRLQPGDKLPPEPRLIELLQSSRGTVREALKVLESQGLVEIMRGPGGGARVSSISHEKASQGLRNFLYFQTPTWAQIYRVRERLEPMVAADVVGILTADDIEALRETIEICERGIAGAVEPRAHRVAELEFHAILARACPDPMLRFLCCFINDLLVDFALADPRDIIEPQRSEFAVDALRFHRALIDAYVATDRDGVRRLMAEHIHDAGGIVAGREQALDRAALLAPLRDTLWGAQREIAASAPPLRRRGRGRPSR